MLNNAAQQNINAWMSHLSEESRFHISVDCSLFGYNGENLKVLLMECDFPLFKGNWSLLGDLLHPEETINSAAQRILFENTNLQDVYLEQVESFSGIDRHPLGRVITLAYYSIINIDEYVLSHPSHLKLRWVNVSEVPELAFDHSVILERCYKMLQNKMHLSPIAFDLLPEKFSIQQLQKLYEKILDVQIDKRNFRRRLKNQGYLIDLEELQDDVSHRPAKLYSFNYDKYQAENQGSKLNFMI